MAKTPSSNGARVSQPRAHALALGLLAAAIASASSAAELTGANPDGSCCNVAELRQYTLHPGRRDAFIELFDREFADPLDATGMTVVGQFRDLDRPDRFVWIRGFQDMDARARELAAFYGGDLWHAHRDEANASIDDSDNVLLLEPASPAGRFRNVPQRPAAGDVTTGTGGLVVVTLYYAKPDSLSAFGAFFDRSLRRRAELAGADTLAEYVTSSQANNFPRLPVRAGEHILVWVAQFASPEAYTTYQSRLEADKQWRRTLWPFARRQLARDPEILRLTPTPRSRLRG
ncbi:MAG TPA: NIPSNAP family protein [Steroidobacteraceae bacterium]